VPGICLRLALPFRRFALAFSDYQLSTSCSLLGFLGGPPAGYSLDNMPHGPDAICLRIFPVGLSGLLSELDGIDVVSGLF